MTVEIGPIFAALVTLIITTLGGFITMWIKLRDAKAQREEAKREAAATAERVAAALATKTEATATDIKRQLVIDSEKRDGTLDGIHDLVNSRLTQVLADKAHSEASQAKTEAENVELRKQVEALLAERRLQWPDRRTATRGPATPSTGSPAAVHGGG